MNMKEEEEEEEERGRLASCNKMNL